MKIGNPNLTNTQQKILGLLMSDYALTTGEIVIAVYPQTRRFSMKCETFRRHLRRLERLGKVRCVRTMPDVVQSLWARG